MGKYLSGAFPVQNGLKTGEALLLLGRYKKTSLH